ncbi:MAG: TatD family hydrolase [Rickettsiales bacterium]|jgi:TatD DNase family protein|nr:TatD family hydrolase [Rickettsiales bacterium]
MPAELNYNYLVDSHCHLLHLQQQEEESSIDCIVKDAYNNNVRVLNNVCTDINEIDSLRKIAENYECVFYTIGRHPENVVDGIVDIDFLVKEVKNRKVIGIGESGLDYHYTTENKAQQKKNFEVHIEACRRTKLPLVVHSRDCDKDMIDILQQEMKNGEFQFVLHCFCSSRELAYIGLDLGGFISFSGILTFKNSSELQSLPKEIPEDRILIETDAPFLAPTPFRGQVNKPMYVKNVAEFLAALLNRNFAYIQNITTRNFFKLFSLCKVDISDI